MIFLSKKTVAAASSGIAHINTSTLYINAADDGGGTPYTTRTGNSVTIPSGNSNNALIAFIPVGKYNTTDHLSAPTIEVNDGTSDIAADGIIIPAVSATSNRRAAVMAYWLDVAANKTYTPSFEPDIRTRGRAILLTAFSGVHPTDAPEATYTEEHTPSNVTSYSADITTLTDGALTAVMWSFDKNASPSTLSMTKDTVAVASPILDGVTETSTGGQMFIGNYDINPTAGLIEYVASTSGSGDKWATIAAAFKPA